jgi:streptogramin lyase
VLWFEEVIFSRHATAFPSLLCLLSVLLQLPAAPAREEDNNAAARAARASLERIQNLRKERPGDGTLVFYEAYLRAGLGERDAAVALLRSLEGRRLGLVPARGAGFDSIWSNAQFQVVRRALADDEPATPNAPVLFRLQDPKLVPEGIAYHPGARRFFISSMGKKKIVVSDENGDAHDFSSPDDKLDQILGLCVDPGGEFLYAVSTNGNEDSAKKQRRNAVVRYDLKTGRLTDRFNASAAAQLNDLTVAPDGTVYATDSAAGSLFRKKPREKTLTLLGEAGGLRGANGIALAEDGTLYVTLSTGIARVDTGTGAATRLPQPDTVATGACDGLYWYQGDLIGIQNVTNPGRVIRMALGENGTRITGVTVLQSHHHPAFDEPTTGAIAHGALAVIANSYVGHLQPDGSIKDPGDLKGTAIIAVPLHPGE